MNKADLPGIISSPKKPNIMQFLFTLKDEISLSGHDTGGGISGVLQRNRQQPFDAFDRLYVKDVSKSVSR